MRSFKTASGGIYRDSFTIPDVSEYVKSDTQLKKNTSYTLTYTILYVWGKKRVGTWKILARYHKDEEFTSREFKVQRFGKILKSLFIVIFPPNNNNRYFHLHSFTKFWSEHQDGALVHFNRWWTYQLYGLSNVSCDLFYVFEIIYCLKINS